MRELHIYETLGRKVRDANGYYVGCLEEIEVERGDDSCLVTSYIVHKRGLISRMTAWAVSNSVRRAIPVPEKALPYRVPWDQMDLSDPEHPQILVAQSELKRVRAVN
jgi:hypothetical protein